MPQYGRGGCRTGQAGSRPSRGQLRALAPAFALAVVVLGKWNWWAPAPLARLHARIGVAEAAR